MRCFAGWPLQRPLSGRPAQHDNRGVAYPAHAAGAAWVSRNDAARPKNEERSGGAGRPARIRRQGWRGEGGRCIDKQTKNSGGRTEGITKGKMTQNICCVKQSANEFAHAAQAAASTAPQVSLVEVLAKPFTLFALYRIREPYHPYAFSVKVEVSLRPEAWDRERDYALRLLTSPVTPVSVLAQVATLERMWSDKQVALAGRRQPRDLYDLWFIAQRLRLPFAADLSGFDRQAIPRELRKYLPRSQWPVIDQWSS